MPFVAVKYLAGSFSREQQAELMADITAAFGKIGGPEICPKVVIVIEEVPSGQWSDGGSILTIEEINRRREQRRSRREGDEQPSGG